MTVVKTRYWSSGENFQKSLFSKIKVYKVYFLDFIGTSRSHISTSSIMAISRRNFNEGCVSLLQIRVIVLGVFFTILAKSF